MKYSIKKHTDFSRIYNEKKSFATKNIIMYISQNCDMERNRLGISVSHKVGNSVIRHKLIRRLREIFRKNVVFLKEKVDIVVVLRKGADLVEFVKLENEFLKLCKKHGVLI